MSLSEEHCMLSCFSRVQLFVILWPIARQAPLSIRFSRQEEWSGLPCPSPGDLLHPGIEHMSPALAGGSLPLAPPGKPHSNPRHLTSEKLAS